MQTKLGIELKFPWLIIIFLIKFAKIEITPQFSARFPWFHHWTLPQLGVDPSWPNLAAGCAAGRSGLAGSAADWGRSWQWRWAGQLNHVFFFYVFRKIDYRLVKDNYWLLLIVSWGWDEFWCFFFFFFNGFGNSVIMVSLYVWWIEDHWLWMGKGWSSIHKLLFVFGDLWWVEEDMLIFFCDFVG